MFVGERAARAGEIGRRVGERGLFPLRFRPALGKFADAALRPIAPLAPGRPLGGDRGAPDGARLSLACDRLRRRARFGEGGPLARSRLARVLEALGDVVARPKLLKRGLGAGFAFGGLVARGAGARKGLLDRRQARKSPGALALELGESVAGGVRRRARGARPLTPFRFRSGGGAGRARCACSFDAQRSDCLARGLGFALKVAKTILLRQATGGRSRRFGGGDEAVPAPEIPFKRDQPLPGLEVLGKPLSFRASDHPDLGEATGKRRRRRDAWAKRIRARRQQWVVAGRLDQRPVRRRRLVDRGVEIIAQRGAKRGLIAARDADSIDRPRPGAARVRAEEASERARLRLQPLRRPFGLGQRPAPARLDLPSLGVARLRRQRFALGCRERLGEFGDGLSARRALGLLEARHIERGALALDRRAFRLEAGEAPPLLLDRRQ